MLVCCSHVPPAGVRRCWTVSCGVKCDESARSQSCSVSAPVGDEAAWRPSSPVCSSSCSTLSALNGVPHSVMNPRSEWQVIPTPRDHCRAPLPTLCEQLSTARCCSFASCSHTHRASGQTSYLSSWIHFVKLTMQPWYTWIPLLGLFASASRADTAPCTVQDGDNFYDLSPLMSK